jgi:hypothetical protein
MSIPVHHYFAPTLVVFLHYYFALHLLLVNFKLFLLTKDGVQNSGEEKPLKPKSPIDPKPHTLTKENFHQKQNNTRLTSVWGNVLRNVDDNFVWAFRGVYGPNDDVERRVLWDELAGLMSWWEVQWCIGGDVNMVRFLSERSEESNYLVAMVEFSEFILCRIWCICRL